MAHFDPAESKKRLRTTAPEWLPIGAQIGKLANDWSKRNDLIVYLGPDAADNRAAACFYPQLAEIEINMGEAFGPLVEPDDLNLTTIRGRLEYPQGIGVTMHEAFHARYTRWDIPQAGKDLERDEFDWLMALEESRIEGLGMRVTKRAREFLQASAMGIIVESLKPKTEDEDFVPRAYTMGSVVALINTRVDLGILKADDVRDVLTMAEDYFGDEKMEALQEIYLEVQAYTNHDEGPGLYEPAKEWARIIRETYEEKGEKDQDQEAMKKALQDLAEALGDAAGKVMVSSAEDVGDAIEEELDAEIAEAMAAAASEANEAKETAAKIFSRSSGPSTGKTNSYLMSEREPTGEEHIAANIISRKLERAQYHDREVREVASVLPPGRLRTRALVQGIARKQHGVRELPAPFRQKKRRHVDDPQLSVGVLVDISGSMHGAMESMASVAWVMSEAVRRVQGRVAMVYYGDSVFHTLAPGDHLTTVRKYAAEDGSEAFDEAFKAIDGSLNLLHGTGARLLFIVSDGYYRPHQIERSQHWMQRCDAMGVAVVMMPFSQADRAEEMVGSHGTVIQGAMSPSDAAMTIGEVCAAELTRAGA